MKTFSRIFTFSSIFAFSSIFFYFFQCDFNQIFYTAPFSKTRGQLHSPPSPPHPSVPSAEQRPCPQPARLPCTPAPSQHWVSPHRTELFPLGRVEGIQETQGRLWSTKNDKLTGSSLEKEKKNLSFSYNVILYCSFKLFIVQFWNRSPNGATRMDPHAEFESFFLSKSKSSASPRETASVPSLMLSGGHMELGAVYLIPPGHDTAAESRSVPDLPSSGLIWRLQGSPCHVLGSSHCPDTAA